MVEHRFGQLEQRFISHIGPYLTGLLHGNFQLPVAAQARYSGLLHRFNHCRGGILHGQLLARLVIAAVDLGQAAPDMDSRYIDAYHRCFERFERRPNIDLR